MKICFFLLLCAFLGAITIDAASVNHIADADPEKNESEKAVQSADVKADDDKDDDDEEIALEDEEIPDDEAMEFIGKVLEKSSQSDEDEEEFDEIVNDLAEADDRIKNSIQTAPKNPGAKGKGKKTSGKQMFWGRRRRRWFRAVVRTVRRAVRTVNVRRLVSTARRGFCCAKLGQGFWQYRYCCLYGKKK